METEHGPGLFLFISTLTGTGTMSTGGTVHSIFVFSSFRFPAESPRSLWHRDLEPCTLARLAGFADGKIRHGKDLL